MCPLSSVSPWLLWAPRRSNKPESFLPPRGTVRSPTCPWHLAWRQRHPRDERDSLVTVASNQQTGGNPTAETNETRAWPRHSPRLSPSCMHGGPPVASVRAPSSLQRSLPRAGARPRPGCCPGSRRGASVRGVGDYWFFFCSLFRRWLEHLQGSLQISFAFKVICKVSKQNAKPKKMSIPRTFAKLTWHTLFCQT